MWRPLSIVSNLREMEGGAAPFFKNDPKAHSFPAVAGIALLGTLCGLVVAVTGLDALYLCGSLIGCAVILYDFRIGVVLLILLAPISGSQVFPHAMLGITGLNPLNLLLAGTFASYLLHGLFDGSIRRFLPGPLLWLYCVPILIAGALGSRHVGDIVPGFFTDKVLDFNDAIGYIRDLVVKPLLTVVFALLVGAAVAKSEKPEKFLIPTVISIWVMGAIVIVFVYSWGIGLGELASSTEREFLTPLGIHANELGRLYAVAYALLLFTWAESKQLWLKAVLLASMVLVVVALTLTFSRSAFFDLVLINLLFVLWRRNVRALVFLAVLAVIALFALPDAIYQRSTAGFGQGLDAISAGRIQGLWLPLLPEVARSPIYGSGLGSILWSEAMHKWGGVTMLATTHPHNAYLQALLDMGIVGLVLLCAYFVHVWRGFRALSVSPDLTPTLRGFYLGAAAGVVGFLIAAVADGSLAPRPEQAFLWLAIGMMYGQRSKTGDAAVAERRR